MDLRQIRRRLLPARAYTGYRARRALRKSYRKAGEGELQLLSFLVPRGRTAVDVGANRGVYAWHLAALTSPVVAYEANPVLARELVRGAPAGVEVRAAAVSDTPGSVTLSIPLDAQGRHRPNVASLEAVEGSVERVEVPAVRLDGEDLADVGFIKIDVEGHEIPVLQGALGLLRRDRPALLVEVLDHDGPHLDAVVDLLEPLGYRPLAFTDGCLRPLWQAGRGAGQRNLIFLPLDVEP